MLNCDKCDSMMVEDYNLSCIYYDETIQEILNSDGEIIFENIPTELVFICRRCGYTKNIDLEDINKMMQLRVVDRLINSRLNIVYKSADKSIIDEANGVSYCGICSGVVDESGFCYNDLISQCVIRKVKINNV